MTRSRFAGDVKNEMMLKKAVSKGSCKESSDSRQIRTVDRFIHSAVLGMWGIKHTM